MEKQQLAVEWLISDLISKGLLTLNGDTLKSIGNAKELEEKQLKDAHFNGQCDETEGYPVEIAEQYYNETFKSE